MKPAFLGSALTRRSFLAAGAAAGLVTVSPGRRRAEATPPEVRLVVEAGHARLVPEPHPQTAVWSYNGQVPGPEIRIRQGEKLKVVVENRLAEETTVHWHGVRVPNAMDGVPHLTQPPIAPGESFVYEFTPPDAGTFWYHPHANSLEQLGRGLAGALIVEETKPVGVDRDILWVLSDWRLTAEGEIASGFGNRMEAGMSGRVGNTVTLNGMVPGDQPVRAGERIRLRLVNTSLARIMGLRFEGHRPVIVAIDGQPCDPHEPAGGRLLLGPAMRIDVMLDMEGEPGRSYRVVDDFYEGLAYWLTHLAYADAPPARDHPLDGMLRLPPNPLPEPDLATAERHELLLEGGMMGGDMMQGMGDMMGGGMMQGMGDMMGGGMMQGMGDMMGHGRAVWTINGTSMTGDGHAGMPPLATLARGRSHVITMRNDTAWWHPMHLHGFSFRVLNRNGTPVPHNQWADTVLMAPKETVDIAFVADNSGDWMLHCHVTDHQTAGLMTVLRVADAKD